jgi:phosphoglycerol transferase MdoB-like AlkP superfamily enzyme
MESFLTETAAPLLAGAALSLAVERLLEPTPELGQRPWRSWAVHLGMWTLAYALVLCVVQRPWFAALLVLAELLFLTIVSNRKVRALREPFVYQDFEYFTDVIKHPRLLLPYLGVIPALVVCCAFGAAIWLGIALETGLPARTGWPVFGAGVAALAAVGAALIWAGTVRPLPPTFRPADDIRRHGQLASFWYYWLAERGRPALPGASRYTGAPARRAPAELPDIVVVQSESFFDARRLHAGVLPNLLESFDAIRAAAVQRGHLRVPAWGGNTARTEFSFLTGLDSARLGVNLFNPYRKLAQQAVPTIAGFLKRAGYRTVCVHPYPVSFYSRDTAYPALGFDEFLDLEAFRDAEHYGPYVSDMAVAQRISRLLDGAGAPRLLFAITMENHGPLHLEKVAPGDVERLYRSPPPAGYDDLTVYLRHLANADRMVRALRERLERSPRAALLCWYGDHVPILPQVYEATGFADARTDYFIWSKDRPPAAASADIGVEELGAALLAHAGLLERP